MFLRLHRLTKDRITPAILILHGASGFFHIVKGFRLDRRGVRDYAARGGVDLHERAATGAAYFKIGFAF